MEPLGHKEQGNGQGTVGGRSRREEQERTSGASGLEQLCQEGYKSPEQRSWSSGSGGEEKEKGRKERAQDKVQASNPGVRVLTGREEGQREGLQGLGYPEEGIRSGAPWGQMKTTVPPFRSSLLLLPSMAASPRLTWPAALPVAWPGRQ